MSKTCKKYCITLYFRTRIITRNSRMTSILWDKWTNNKIRLDERRHDIHLSQTNWHARKVGHMKVPTTPLVQWTGGIQPGEKPGEKNPKNQEPGEKQPDLRSTRWNTKVVANPVKISMNKAQPGENSTCRLSPVIIPCDPVKILVRYH